MWILTFYGLDVLERAFDDSWWARSKRDKHSCPQTGSTVPIRDALGRSQMAPVVPVDECSGQWPLAMYAHEAATMGPGATRFEVAAQRGAILV